MSDEIGNNNKNIKSNFFINNAMMNDSSKYILFKENNNLSEKNNFPYPMNQSNISFFSNNPLNELEG